MQGFARLLLEEHSSQLTAEARGYLERIASSASRMDLLIQDVLNYTRVLQTQTPLVPVDLDRLVHHLIATYPEWQPPDTEIRIEGRFPTVLGHEGFLTQCVSNLVSNGVKFVPPGTKPRIRIWSETIGSRILVCFEDNGIGIAPKDHDRIFRMFERLNPSDRYEGTGIGLTIVRKAVERMGGRVGFESEPGRGSKFWIELKQAS
jgi:signal transduction histidine kinase